MLPPACGGAAGVGRGARGHFRAAADAAGETADPKPVVMCGDFNVAHQEIDLKNPGPNRGKAGFSDEERGKFTRLAGGRVR